VTKKTEVGHAIRSGQVVYCRILILAFLRHPDPSESGHVTICCFQLDRREAQQAANPLRVRRAQPPVIILLEEGHECRQAFLHS